MEFSCSKAPVITVIMPVYNASKFIREAIESIIMQSFTDWELLICDDSSTDDSNKIIKSFKDERIRFFENSENIGYLRTCNRMFQEARGEFITWQDADDLSSPDRLSKQLLVFKSNPNTILCGTGALYFNTDILKPVRFKTPPTRYSDILKDLEKGSQFCGASVLVRKEVLLNSGGYKTFFDRIGNEDYDCFYRIAERGEVLNLNEVLYYVRLSPNSISRTIKNPRQLISDKVVQFLAHQRRQNNGLDSLTGLDVVLVLEAEAKLIEPYIKDPSLVKREEANKHAYNGMMKDAFLSSLSAFLIKPRLINVKYAISCFYRMIFKL